MNWLKLRHYIVIVLAVVVALHTAPTHAFSTQVYAENSKLSQGRLMKVSVDSEGLYLISTEQLQSWGMTPSKVRVYGYGGHRLPDVLNEVEYLDDLPEVQSVLTDKGLVFYGLAGGEWVKNKATGNYYFLQNDFSDYGYYFIGESDEPRRDISSTGTAGAASPSNSYMCRVHHEKELVASPGESGPTLLGEEFRYTRSRSFTFETIDAIAGEEAVFELSFVSDIGGSAVLKFTVNGEAQPAEANDYIAARTSTGYVHGTESIATHYFTCSPTEKGAIEIGITLETSASISGAWLNYLTISYPRRLKMPSNGVLPFNSAEPMLCLEGATSGVQIWDISNPNDIHLVAAAESGDGKASWSMPTAVQRDYVAWQPNATLPSPKSLGFVRNQNLHADRDIDMVIVSPALYYDEATRLAKLHETSADSLKVKTVTPEEVYNEFSSGTPDPGAFRRYFKMLYDRGQAGDGRPLRYAIFMARTTIDNRNLSIGAPGYPTLPSWMPTSVQASLSDNEGYCSDDVTAMLEDGSGLNKGVDKLSIAIGRIPVISVQEAHDIVDKAYQYAEKSRKTAWKHHYMFLADDQDNSVHMLQTEMMISQFENADRQQHFLRKVYLDAYPFENSTYPVARTTMFRYLDEGVVWWNYIGHANTTGWTAEKMLSYTDINNMYLRNWPFIYAATCDFLRLDGTAISGGEILYKERYGGAIGIVSAVRPVYISNNEWMSNAIGRALAIRDDKGRLLPPGDIYRIAKNDIRNKNGVPVSDTNRLRYSFIGDPALRLAMPSNIVSLDSIGNVAVGGNEQPTMRALEQVSISGTVRRPDGSKIDGFNGVVLVEIYDAELSRTTLGSRDESSQEVFQDYGARIYCGSTEVKDGTFHLIVAMPLEVSQNFRPATMSMYAYSTEDDTEAVGLNRAFYVYGYDESVPDDNMPPTIESLVLNHSSFKSGDTVNASPMLIASIRDDIGINMSNSGIGHQMIAILDSKQTFTDLAYYYTPAADGSASGIINYPFEDLQAGNHTLALRIWDTAGNSAVEEIDFFVQENLAPKIYDVYTDANPASTQANFYISHDQPDNMLTVTVSVYNLLGQPIWSGTATGRSDMFLTVPVTWNLTDGAGRRVGRGIYLYRATITSNGTSYSTASRRIAVTAQ